MELIETERFERIEKSVIEIAEFLRALEEPNGAHRYYQRVIDRLKLKREPTPFQKHMAKTRPGVEPGHVQWIDEQNGWNAAMDAGIVKRVAGDQSLPWVAVSALKALKEP